MTAKKLHLLWLICPVLVTIAIGAWFLKTPPVDLSDLSKEEEPFRSMAMPPKSVASGMIMDGGSILIRIIEAHDVEFWIKFPYDHEGIVTPYKTALYGNTNPKGTNVMSPLKNPGRAKTVAIQILRTYEIPGPEKWNRSSADRLSNSPTTLGKTLARRIRGHGTS